MLSTFWRTVILSPLALNLVFSEHPYQGIPRAFPHHPTIGESQEAVLAFLDLMNQAGYGHTPVVVFGAASIRSHFDTFRSTPVWSRRIRP
jgi:hypothetical protein